MSDTPSVVVTGCNGQLAQYLIKHILSLGGVRVIGTLRHKTARSERYIFPIDQIAVELMDLSDSHSIETLIQTYKPTFFINTAANAFVGESWRVPVQHLEINAIAVLHQLEAIRKHSPHTRYLNLGTSEEFGAVEYSPQDELHPQRPMSPYGVAKCAARHLVRVWRESYRLFAIQPWCFNFESPLRDPKYLPRKVSLGVARIASSIRARSALSPIELGNLDARRSWQHASDVADGLWRMITQEKPIEYVLSAPDTHTVRELVDAAFATIGVKGAWMRSEIDDPKTEALLYVNDASVAVPLVTVNPSFYRPADVQLLHGNASRARTELGWSPKVTFPQLVREMVTSDLAAQCITI